MATPPSSSENADRVVSILRVDAPFAHWRAKINAAQSDRAVEKAIMSACVSIWELLDQHAQWSSAQKTIQLIQVTLIHTFATSALYLSKPSEWILFHRKKYWKRALSSWFDDIKKEEPSHFFIPYVVALVPCHLQDMTKDELFDAMVQLNDDDMLPRWYNPTRGLDRIAQLFKRLPTEELYPQKKS
jgi:hypothetical protein